MSEPAKIITLTLGELESLLERAAERGAMRALAGDQSDNGCADRWLTAEEAATRLNVTTGWIYRHAEKWPFARRLSRKNLRVSEAGLLRWIAARRPS